MAERKFPIQDGPSVPWEFMVSHEAQHKKNHGGQTLERMAQRGGLGATEAWCCVNGMGLWPTHDTKEGMAKAHQDWIALAERVNREWNEKSIQAEVLAACISGARVYFDDFRDVPPPPITIEEVIRFLRGVQPAAEALEALLREERKKGLELANLVYKGDTNFCLTSEATRAGRMESYDVWNRIFAEAINIRAHEKEKARAEGRGIDGGKAG